MGTNKTTKNNSSKTRTIAFVAIALAVLAVIIIMVFADSAKKNNDDATDKPISELEVNTEEENEISFDDFEQHIIRNQYNMPFKKEPHTWNYFTISLNVLLLIYILLFYTLISYLNMRFTNWYVPNL